MHFFSKPSQSHISSPKRYGLATAAPGEPGFVAVLLVNGILSAPNSWQIPACEWGNTNTPYHWSYYHYDADALLARWWQKQHAQELATAVAAIYAAGASVVHVISHSEGHEVTARSVYDFGAKYGRWFSLAGAAKEDCEVNGVNGIISSGHAQRICFAISKNDGVLGWPQIFTPFFWGKTLGLNGPKNFKMFVPEVPFKEIPAQNSTGLVGRDDTQTHFTWPCVATYQTIAAAIATYP